MRNAMANGVWKKTVKTAVGSVTAVLLTNFSDPKGITFSTEWFRHVALACLILFVVNEAKYWKSWANSNGGSNGDDSTTSTTSTTNLGTGR